jgi:branched-chain amino acid transport system ATP-binding protein
MLRMQDARVLIGAVEALRGFSLEVPDGAMIGLSGRNGAGKTTVMRAIMGLVPVRHGQITFDGQDLAKVPIHGRASLGIGYMPEDRGLVPELTVEENILLPAWVTKSLDGKARLELVYDIMPELKPMAGRKALQLSGGQQKLAALGRALVAGTRLLLLDEPFEGVAPALSQRLAEVIATFKQQNLSVLLSQSELNHAFSLFDDDYVIERGQNVAEPKAA